MRIHDYAQNRDYYQKVRKRYEDPQQAREFTFTCFRRYKFLNRDRTRRWFLAELDAARHQHGFHIWAYVLMPEHVHLLLWPNGRDLQFGRIVGHIKERVSRRAIAWLEENAPHWLERISVQEGSVLRRRFWQPGGGFDRNVVELDTAQQMIDYIHANPVRRGLVDRAEDWKWSSAAWYCGQTNVPLAIDATVPAS
jgi:putative transposase